MADDLTAICAHHGYSVNAVLKMLVSRVVDYSERLPAAMEAYGEKHGKGSVESSA
jgi:hypothetical protein